MDYRQMRITHRTLRHHIPNPPADHTVVLSKAINPNNLLSNARRRRKTHVLKTIKDKALI